MIMERGLEFWSITDVKSWASDALGSDIADLFEKEEITGECLSEISVEELKEMGVQKMGKRLLVMKKLKTLVNHNQSNGHSDSGVEAEGGVYSSTDSSPDSAKISRTPPLKRSPSSSPVSESGLSPTAAVPLLAAAPVVSPLSTLPSVSLLQPPLVVPTPRAPFTPPLVTSPSTVIRAPIAHIPSHLDLYHVPKRMRLSPPSFPPTMLHSTVAASHVSGTLEEALTKLNSYSDMARALSHQTLASSVCSLLGVPDHTRHSTRHGQILKPIPHISSVTSHALPTPSTGSTQGSPINTSPSLSDMLLDMKPSMLSDMKPSMLSSLFTKVSPDSSPAAPNTEHHPPTISVGDTVFQVNCRGKLTRESQERLKQVNPRLHSHYLTKRNLIKRACRTVFPDPPPFFYTDADRNSQVKQEDLQILEQLTEKLAPVCCIPELCFSAQGIRNHIIDSCRERRRECKRQSYRPSKARPAGHLYNSDGSQMTEPVDLTGHKEDANDRPYTLSQDSADCIIRVLFNVESVYHVRRSVHLIPITKKLGLSQRVDKNWMIMAIAQGLLNNGYISFNPAANLEHLTPTDFVLEVPEELLSFTDDIDVN